MQLTDKELAATVGRVCRREGITPDQLSGLVLHQIHDGDLVRFDHRHAAIAQAIWGEDRVVTYALCRESRALCLAVHDRATVIAHHCRHANLVGAMYALAVENWVLRNRRPPGVPLH